jgi:hypothetical protein
MLPAGEKFHNQIELMGRCSLHEQTPFLATLPSDCPHKRHAVARPAFLWEAVLCLLLQVLHRTTACPSIPSR